MQISTKETEGGVVLAITGLMKKADGMALSDHILQVGKKKPVSLTLELSQLIAASNDSIPFVTSALERSRIGKANIKVTGANEIVMRTLRGMGFERVGSLE